MHRLLGVEYLYEAQPHEQSPTQSPVGLWTVLSKLPETLRAQLTEALVFGSSNRLAAALGQVRDVSPAAADALEPYIQEFNYSPVLEALEAQRSQQSSGPGPG